MSENNEFDYNLCEQVASCATTSSFFANAAATAAAAATQDAANVDANDELNAGYADDATWVLTSSFVILTMQSGFGLLEMGSSSPGNEVNIMLKNIFDVVFGSLSYYLVGYGISYGDPSNPFMGLGDFVPDSVVAQPTESGLRHSRYLFQLSFAATSTTIVSGAVAMRMKFSIYCTFAFFAVIFYSFVAHWFWADDGWLNQLGVHDFAGSGPVHLLGGMNGLAGILMVGPRTGRFDGSRPKSDFKPSSPTSMLFGLFMLWWGWIGFNCGSSFGITGNKWLLATRAGVNTINSTAGGGCAALVYTQIRTKRKHVLPTYVANGILGALVGVTASCAVIHTYEALIVGIIGSFVANIANDIFEYKAHVDDPVGAVGVHAVAGVWGLLSVGFFADGELVGVNIDSGLFRGGGFRQLGVQLLAAVAVMAWSFLCVIPFFYLLGVIVGKDKHDPRKGLRLSDEEERVGADEYLHDSRDPTQKLIEESLTATFGTASRRLDLASNKQPTMSSSLTCIDESEETTGTAGAARTDEIEDGDKNSNTAANAEETPRLTIKDRREYFKQLKKCRSDPNFGFSANNYSFRKARVAFPFKGANDQIG